MQLLPDDAVLDTRVQILFVAGVAMVIGLQNTALFFLKRARGAACFLGGMVLVFFGWPITGMLIEVFGIFNLFGYVSRDLIDCPFARVMLASQRWSFETVGSFTHCCPARGWFV
jgi:hypothetical protein